jgi:hypothetical protein
MLFGESHCLLWESYETYMYIYSVAKMEIYSNVKWYIWVLHKFFQGRAASKYGEEEIVVCV